MKKKEQAVAKTKPQLKTLRPKRRGFLHGLLATRAAIESLRWAMFRDESTFVAKIVQCDSKRPACTECLHRRTQCVYDTLNAAETRYGALRRENNDLKRQIDDLRKTLASSKVTLKNGRAKLTTSRELPSASITTRPASPTPADIANFFFDSCYMLHSQSDTIYSSLTWLGTSSELRIRYGNAYPDLLDGIIGDKNVLKSALRHENKNYG